MHAQQQLHRRITDRRTGLELVADSTHDSQMSMQLACISTCNTTHEDHPGILHSLLRLSVMYTSNCGTSGHSAEQFLPHSCRPAGRPLDHIPSHLSHHCMLLAAGSPE